MSKHKRLPNAKRCEHEMSKIRGTVEAALFVSRVQARYDELRRQGLTYTNKALRFHFEDNILPAVAAYSVLMMDGMDKESALQVLDRLLEVSVESQRRMYRFWGRFPFFFDLIRLALKPMMRSQYPSEGWETEWIDFTRDRVGVNCRSCFYMDRLSEYGFSELTSHFCRLDDLLAEAAGSSIRLERTQTIGRGGTMCDFRYSRVKAH